MWKSLQNLSSSLASSVGCELLRTQHFHSKLNVPSFLYTLAHPFPVLISLGSNEVFLAKQSQLPVFKATLHLPDTKIPHSSASYLHFKVSFIFWLSRLNRGCCVLGQELARQSWASLCFECHTLPLHLFSSLKRQDSLICRACVRFFPGHTYLPSLGSKVKIGLSFFP